MKKSYLISSILFGLMLILGVASSVISYVDSGVFGSFEILYFVCLILGAGMVLYAKRIEMHALASILIVSIGLGVNTFVWGLNSQGYSLVLNVIIGCLSLLSIVYFAHSYFKVLKLQKFMWIFSMVFALVIVSLAIVKLATFDYQEASQIAIFANVISCVSLLSTIGLPIAEYLIIRERK